jgi:hypothetical protein
MMQSLTPQQEAWWDVLHRKCVIGGQRAGATHYIRFPRTTKGKLSLSAAATFAAALIAADRIDRLVGDSGSSSSLLALLLFLGNAGNAMSCDCRPLSSRWLPTSTPVVGGLSFSFESTVLGGLL